MDAEVCPEDGVPTIESSVFDAPEEAISEGMIIADRYRVIRLCGRGAMGSVFEATQLSVDRRVALKTLQKNLISDQKHVKRFYLEARAASKLDHPNIVRIFDFGIDDGTKVPYIAMEFLEGRDLGDTIELTGAIPEKDACRLLSQVAKALVAAHESGIVHRDLKPDNIHLRTLADGDQHAKVLDFGIAKVLQGGSDSLKSLTGTGMTMGTPLYMSPEQIRGEKVDFRSDLYALGCILHELVTGVRPYTSEERMGIFMQHISGEVPTLPDVLIDKSAPSDGLRILHHSLLEKRREERPSSTTAVAKILTALSRGDAVDVPETLGLAEGSASVMATDPNQRATSVSGMKLGTDQTLAAPALGTAPSSVLASGGVSEDGVETIGGGLSAELRSPRRSPWALAVGLLVVLGAAAFFLLRPQFAAEPTAASPAAAEVKKDTSPSDAGDSTKAAKEEPAPQRAEPAAPDKPLLPAAVMRVETEPTGATVREGTLALGTSPVEILIPEGVAGRTLSIEMEGHRPKAVLATRDQPSPFKVKLEALPAVKPAAKVKPKRSRRPSRSHTAKTPSPSPAPAKKVKKPKDVPIW